MISWEELETDNVQEFVDARRRVVTLQNAPQVLFRSDPPLELEGVPGLNNTGEGEISYVTFGMDHYAGDILDIHSITDQSYVVLFPRHLTPQRRYENISHIQTFRDYFHYHIKASKVCLNLYVDLFSISCSYLPGVYPYPNA